LGTSLHFILNTFSNKTYSLLSGQDYQAIQACNCKDIRFKLVRWHDDRPIIMPSNLYTVLMYRGAGQVWNVVLNLTGQSTSHPTMYLEPSMYIFQ